GVDQPTTGRGWASLTAEERRHYRDRLRDARLASLADAEGFHQVCFAVEALGLRLLGRKGDLGKYWEELRRLAMKSAGPSELSDDRPAFFRRYEVLFKSLQDARNEAMHSGAYARHAAAAAIELCLVLEEGLMSLEQPNRSTVGDYMVRSPVAVEDWQPLAHA